MSTQKKTLSGNALMLLFAAAYFVSYLTRTNYGAVISEMITATGHSKQMLSMAVTGSFFTYGAGQIVSGIAGDRISPKKLLGAGLLLTACMNLALPLCATPWQMLAVWCVNGFAQAFMWPPLLKLMTVFLPEEDYQKGVLWASYGCSGATVTVYLLSPVLIALASWKSVFLAAGLSAAVMLVLWLLLCPEPGIVQSPQKTQAPADSGKKLLLAPMMLGIMGAIILHGILKDGVATWMPTYIVETYQASNLIAILSGVIMPVFSMISVKCSSLLYRRFFTNPVACAAVIFGGSTAAAILLALLSGASAPLSVLLMALLTGSMHGVNLMLISSIPPFFKPHRLVSTASGLLNACTYVGSAISTYAIASLSGSLGWSFTLWSWVLIAACAGLLCLLSMAAFRKKML